jgi:hypothetical protein
VWARESSSGRGMCAEIHRCLRVLVPLLASCYHEASHLNIPSGAGTGADAERASPWPTWTQASVVKSIQGNAPCGVGRCANFLSQYETCFAAQERRRPSDELMRQRQPVARLYGGAETGVDMQTIERVVAPRAAADTLAALHEAPTPHTRRLGARGMRRRSVQGPSFDARRMVS